MIVGCVLTALEYNEFEERRHTAYTEYGRLKGVFVDFIGYVPLARKNLTVFSPRLASLITDVCEQILDCLEIWVSAPRETIKHLGGTLILKSINTFEFEQKQFLIKMEERKRQHKSMTLPSLLDFIKRHHNFYGTLCDSVGDRVFVIEFQDFIHPFTTARRRGARWWYVYNSLKHDKYRFREKATLRVALHCLAALYRLATYDHKPDSQPLLFSMHPVGKFSAT
jgi:hypothetical protein